jgi:hypothetical protein
MFFIYGQAMNMPSAIGAAVGCPSVSRQAAVGSRLWRFAKSHCGKRSQEPHSLNIQPPQLDT